MNKNRIKNKNKDACKRLITVDPNKCTKISMEMGFLKANVMGGFVGFLAAVIAWAITIPFMGIVRYQILGTFLTEKAYKIAIKFTEIAQKLNIMQTLSYEQALTVRDISYAIFVVGFFIALTILTILHEFTHKWVWQFGFDKETKRKGFKIGIKKLTPYCHCKIDMSLKKMILGTIAPTITTGLLVVMIGAFLQDPILVILGLFGVVAGGADQTQVLMLLPYLKKAKKKRIICGDLEDAFGCILYIEN
jgi:hypothetical protein